MKKYQITPSTYDLCVYNRYDWYTMIQNESQYCLCSHQAWCKEETRSKVLASLSFQLHANLPATWCHIHDIWQVYQYPMTPITKGNFPNHLNHERSWEIMRASNSLVRHLGGYLGSCCWSGLLEGRSRLFQPKGPFACGESHSCKLWMSRWRFSASQGPCLAN